jgi:UDP-glucose 4-epimerase
MLNDEHPPIYGTGRQSRDFTYVDNVVEANILAARNNRIKGDVFNVACGRDYSILELVKILNKLMRKNIKPIFLPKRPGDVFKTKADVSKAKRLLGFTPRMDFIQGLKLTVEWFRKNE